MAYGIRSEGPTPAGGTYSIAYYTDADGNPCAQDESAFCEIIEYDDEDKELQRTYMERNP